MFMSRTRRSTPVMRHAEPGPIASRSRLCGAAFHAAPRPGHEILETTNGPRPCTPQRIRFQLLAGVRRRAVDAGAVDRVPAVGVPGGAVLPVAGSHRQGQGAGAAQRQDRAAQRPAVAGKARQDHARRPGRDSCAPASPPPRANATASRGFRWAGRRRRRRPGPRQRAQQGARIRKDGHRARSPRSRC